MEKQVDPDGVRTWYAEYGDGPPLVLLHPGGVGVDSRAFGPNVGALAERFRVYTPDRRAHGRTPDTDAPLSYELMADDTAGFLRTVVGGPAHLLGCSDGAVVALLTALRHPDLVDRLVFVAGVFHRDGWLPGVLDGEDETSVVGRKLARMHAEGPSLGADDLAKVAARTLVMIGDDDEVAFEHAVALYRGLPTAEFAVVPGTSHGLLVEKPALCNRIALDFLTTEPVETLAPIRRRSL